MSLPEMKTTKWLWLFLIVGAIFFFNFPAILMNIASTPALTSTSNPVVLPPFITPVAGTQVAAFKLNPAPTSC